MEDQNFEPTVRVLITAFGTYRQFKTNPSHQIASLLPSSLSHRGISVKIVQPPSPTQSSYNHIIGTIPKLIEEYQPNVIISIGQDELASDFMIERGARRDVYFELPDSDMKTLTRKETKKVFEGLPERLETGVDLDDVILAWRRNLEGRRVKKKRSSVGLGVSDDAGNYVCGLLYYAVLADLKKRGDEKMKAVFLHVPPLKSAQELKVGAEVVEALINALVDACDI